jgi:hypothetical protein
MASVPITGSPEGTHTPTTMRSILNRDGGPTRGSQYIMRMGVPRWAKFAEYTKYQPYFTEISYLCENIEFPGRGFQSVDYRYYGPNFKLPHQSDYEDLNLSILCRNKFMEKELFDTWMEYINPSNTYDFNYRDSYTTTIEIFKMSDIEENNQSQAVYKIICEEAYPILLPATPLSWADGDFMRLPVSFTYLKWSRQKELNLPDPDTYKLVKAPAGGIITTGTKFNDGPFFTRV